eukprot:scaffold225823_cov20-Cyclotella_meneghiniana.AAC.1
MAEYLGFWIGRAGLWTNEVIGLIEEATDRFLFSSSQGLEGLAAFQLLSSGALFAHQITLILRVN